MNERNGNEILLHRLAMREDILQKKHDELFRKYNCKQVIIEFNNDRTIKTVKKVE